NFDAGSSTVSEVRANARSLWTMIRSGTDATVCATTIPRAISTSEGYSRAELNVARIVAVLIHDSECRVAWILIGIPQHRVIERVDSLDPDLQIRSTGDRESLVETEIEKVEIC